MLPWGAMLENLHVDPGMEAPVNSTFTAVSWNAYFTNSNQYFRLVGNPTGSVHDRSGGLVGAIAPVHLLVRRGESFSGRVSALLPTSALQPGGGTFDLAFVNPGYLNAQITVPINA